MLELLEIMARLRDPDGGCPWDLAQTFESIAPYTIEEAYEVADAIERRDLEDLREELGDLLLQVVFHSQMASEAAQFDFADVAEAVARKLVRRHPHVFGETAVADAAATTEVWETQKAAERSRKAAVAGRRPSTLDGVATTLPALARAVKLQRRAARVGFDWPDAAAVLEKLREEIDEVVVEIPRGDPGRLEDELGDVLFVCVNLALHLRVDPEAALKRTNAKFERRFRRVEALLAERGRTPTQSDLAEMDALWSQATEEDHGQGR